MVRKPRSTERPPLRGAVTGGAGFVGHAVVQRLRERGDQVVALVRDAARAQHLAEMGAELMVDDLSDIAGLTEQLKGADGLPTRLLRAMAPLGVLIGQPNLAEVISASAGVTYWATADKATAELGFESRPIEDGLRDTFGPG